MGSGRTDSPGLWAPRSTATQFHGLISAGIVRMSVAVCLLWDAYISASESTGLSRAHLLGRERPSLPVAFICRDQSPHWERVYF